MARRRCVALLALVLAGCGSPLVSIPPTPSATPTAGPMGSPFIEHPTGALDVVLRMSVDGGLPLYIGPTYRAPVVFTLFGDGRVIYTSSGQQSDPYAPHELRVAQLTAEQTTNLLLYALGDGGMAAARSHYSEAGITDDATTTFVVNAGGIQKSVAVYAIGHDDETTPDQAARRALNNLAERLRDFGSEVGPDRAADLGPFEPEAYSISLDRCFYPEQTANAEWPWADLLPEDFAPVADQGSTVLTVDAQHGQAVLELGIWDGLIVSASDGTIYQIKIRPMLPDEVVDGFTGLAASRC